MDGREETLGGGWVVMGKQYATNHPHQGTPVY